MPISDRLHYMDNLRALAMLAGVLFHAALAYSPLAHPLFPTADRGNDYIVDVVAWFLHLFRMPVFFVVAGFFTALQVQRGGLAGMFRSRLLRVGLPFLLFAPLVHYALVHSTLDAAVTVQNPSPLLLLIREYLQTADPQAPPPGSGHMWFLYYLLLFCVLVWVARALGLGAFAERIVRLHPAVLPALLPLLLLPALASVPAPHPAPESLLPQFWALAYFGPFFAFGYLLQGHPELADRYRGQAPWLFAASLLLYAVFLSLLGRQAATLGASASWAIALLEAVISVWMSLVCLSAGRRLLDRRHRVLRYVADASYWTYLVHLPILFAIQYRLLDVDLHWTAKFALSVLLTLALCLLGYQLLVRHTPLGRLLGSRVPAAARPLQLAATASSAGIPKPNASIDSTP
jgi:glucans biosynthesis protein C